MENPWKIIDGKEIYDNPWIQLTEYNVINPNGGAGIYGKIHMKHLALGVLALDEAENTYLVGQYRFSIDQYSWEIPEGGGEKGEAPLVGAQRELLEETGLKATHWEKLLELHTSNSVTDEQCIVYIAKGLSQHQTHPDDTEDLKLKKLPFDDVLQMVLTGQITDAITVAAVLKYAAIRSL